MSRIASVTIYDTALAKKPSDIFRDKALVKSIVQLSWMGSPESALGTTSVVYKVVSEKGSSAIKCFLDNTSSELESRYAAISKFLSSNKTIPGLHVARFLKEGILVDNTWQPLIEMPWIEGALLYDFLDSQKGNRETLLLIASEFQRVISELNKCGVAHGDLDANNIIISGQQIHFVDYDSLFVPKLRGQSAIEVGNGNYQMPSRTLSHFSSNVGNFSAWAIYVSIVSFALDPVLWNNCSNTRDRLLFKKEDYEKPESSPIFSRLADHPDQRLNALSNYFKSLLSLDPLSVPDLRYSFEQPPRINIDTSESKNTNDKVARTTLSDSVPLKQAPNSRSVHSRLQPADTQQGQQIIQNDLSFTGFGHNTMIARLSVVFAVLAIIICIVRPPQIPCSPLPMVATVLAIIWTEFCFLLICFYTEPFWKRLQRASLCEQATYDSFRDLYAKYEQQILGWEKEREPSKQAYNATKADLLRKRTDVNAQCELQESEIRNQVVCDLALAHNAWKALDEQEADALKQLNKTDLAGLKIQLRILDEDENNEFKKALESEQIAFRENYVKSKRLDKQEVKEISEEMRSFLVAAGIVCPADVTPQSLKRAGKLDPSIQVALLGWRSEIETEAKQKTPTAISPNAELLISQKYAVLKRPLQAEIAEVENTQELFRIAKQRAKDFERKTRERADEQLRAIANRQQNETATIDKSLEQLAQQYILGSREIEEKCSHCYYELANTANALRKANDAVESYSQLNHRKYIRSLFLLKK